MVTFYKKWLFSNNWLFGHIGGLITRLHWILPGFTWGPKMFKSLSVTFRGDFWWLLTSVTRDFWLLFDARRWLLQEWVTSEVWLWWVNLLGVWFRVTFDFYRILTSTWLLKILSVKFWTWVFLQKIWLLKVILGGNSKFLNDTNSEFDNCRE